MFFCERCFQLFKRPEEFFLFFLRYSDACIFHRNFYEISVELGVILSFFTPNSELRTLPGMVAGREDTIIVGTLILQSVMKRLQISKTIVSDRGLRFGLFYERFSEKK